MRRRGLGFLLAMICVIFSVHTVSIAETITREGQHLRLTSDVDDASLLDDMVATFDAAVPQWLAFWGVPPERVANWRIDGYLMKQVDAFRRQGLLPPSLPPFDFGYASPTTIWVCYQPTRHYNRHLILHEGVHSLAIELFGGGGPSWYMEGTAELLATHRDFTAEDDVTAKLSLAQRSLNFRINQIPRNSSEAPFWGRFRVVEEARSEDRLPTLRSVMKLPTDLAGDVDAYTWTWAAAILLTRMPSTRAAFIEAATGGRDGSPAFTAKFFRELQSQWPVVEAQWRLLLHDLEYGFTPADRIAELSTDDSRFDGKPRSIDVAANRAWHSAGVWFPAGTVLTLLASGRCEIASGLRDAATWTSQPPGVSARWHRGWPVGQLQVCVLPIALVDGKTMPDVNVRAVVPLDAWPVARDTAEPDLPIAFEGDRVTIEQPSWLLFRIHDSPHDDAGSAQLDRQRSLDGGRYQVRIAIP